MVKDSIKQTLFVVILLCLVCSLIVSTAAVLLKPIQTQNKLLDKQQYILEAANLIDVSKKYSKKEILDIYNKYVKAKVIVLKTGEFSKLDAKDFNERKDSKDPNLSSTPVNDIASIRKITKNALVYLIYDDNKKIKSVILPIHGYGLWSTMYAFLALEPDLNTVQNLTYYDQKETPGLGAEVTNPRWKEKWHGKKLFNDKGKLGIKVTKDPNIGSTPFGVDALSGATLTSNGVQYSLEFWLGPEGYAPFISKAKSGGLNNVF